MFNSACVLMREDRTTTVWGNESTLNSSELHIEIPNTTQPARDVVAVAFRFACTNKLFPLHSF